MRSMKVMGILAVAAVVAALPFIGGGGKVEAKGPAGSLFTGSHWQTIGVNVPPSVKTQWAMGNANPHQVHVGDIVGGQIRVLGAYNPVRNSNNQNYLWTGVAKLLQWSGGGWVMVESKNLTFVTAGTGTPNTNTAYVEFETLAAYNSNFWLDNPNFKIVIYDITTNAPGQLQTTDMESTFTVIPNP